MEKICRQIECRAANLVCDLTDLRQPNSTAGGRMHHSSEPGSSCDLMMTALYAVETVLLND